MKQSSSSVLPMRLLGYAALSVYSLLVSCTGEGRQEREQQEQVLVEEGITYTQSQGGFALSSDLAHGFEFTYTHANRTCLYENEVDLANKRIYTDADCDGTIDSTLWADCSDPASCIFLDVDPELQRRDIERIAEARERLHVDHYRSVWQESHSAQNR